MNEELIRQRLASNLTHYRKLMGLTQMELSAKLNYSDKSISKWERGEGVPDIFVLLRLADLFGISLDDLFAETPKRRITSHSQKLLITFLSVGLVWFLATFAFFVCKVALPHASYVWMAFIIAIPVSAIVLIVFTVLWWPLITRFLSVSLLLWGGALTFHLPLHAPNIPLVYVLTGVFQVLVVLWYILQHLRRRGKNWRKMLRKEVKQSIPHTGEEPTENTAEASV